MLGSADINRVLQHSPRMQRRVADSSATNSVNGGTRANDDDIDTLDSSVPLLLPMLGSRKDLLPTVNPWQQLGRALKAMDVDEWKAEPWYWKIYGVLKWPIAFLLTITNPVVDFEEEDENWKRLLSALQMLCFPIFVILGTGCEWREGVVRRAAFSCLPITNQTEA